jgi:TRAP transporter TAXI family solute receptor
MSISRTTIKVPSTGLLATGLFSAIFCLGLALPALPAAAQAQKASVRVEEKKRQTNDIAVSIITSGITCTCARFAEDIRNVVNDLKPDGIRVLPVSGMGGLQNLNDVLFLNGIDMGVVDEDNLALLKKRDPQLYANIEKSVQYITKLYNSEYHVLARSDIKSFDDLRGKKVSFNLKDSQTEVTSEVIFDMLKIDGVQRVNYDNDFALKKLREGEISAMIILSGAPQAAVLKVTKADNLHLLALDERSLPGHDLHPMFAKYLPIELTHEQYPPLIPEGQTVSTVGIRSLLVTYAWPEGSVRYNRIAKFVQTFFNKIDQFHDGSRHPKWEEISLAAEMPGWTRFKPAVDWLAEHRSMALKPAFDQFVQNNATATGQKGLSDRDRELLFVKFQQYLQSQITSRSAR